MRHTLAYGQLGKGKASICFKMPEASSLAGVYWAMIEKVPREVEAKYAKYVKLRETLSKILQEKALAEAALAEANSILEKLSSLPDDAEVYKMQGFVLVKVAKADLVKELEEKKEDLEIKLKALEAQEKKIKEELERLAEELKKLLGGTGAAGIGG